MKDIHSRKPIDRIAAKVVSNGPDYSLSEMKSSNPWDSYLPYVCLACPDKVDNLIGQKWGRITVIGFHGTRRSGQKKAIVSQKWVVRCACGIYSVRTSQAIKRKSNPDECCGRCEYLNIVRKRASGLGIVK